MAALRDAGLTRRLGVAPGPANGFTLDVIDCLERFGELIDWAMVILNPLEPWPGELVLPAAQRYDIDVITRVVDYGGLFWDDVRPGHAFAAARPSRLPPRRAGWSPGRERLERMRPIAERHGLTALQLACQWNLAHVPVRCAVPTLIEEPGAAKPIEAKRAELAAVPRELVLSDDEVAEIRAIGDNTGCMALKGASPQFEGEPQPDRWPLTERAARAGRALGDRARARAGARDMTAPPAGKRGPGRRPGRAGRGRPSSTPPGRSSPRTAGTGPRSAPSRARPASTPLSCCTSSARRPSSSPPP